MACQYHPQPQPLVHSYPLLDQQYNPTDTLRSFSNAVFGYLDMHHEPKNTQLLEPTKMKALLTLMVPKGTPQANLRFSNLIFYATFSAYQVETVFTTHGPSVTRAGLVTYFRSEMMGDPDESFRSFNAVNQVMRLGPSFERSQLPSAPESKAEELGTHVQTNIAATIKEMDSSADSDQEEELTALRVQQALEAQGQQAALDLISPSVCYNCRRYPCTCRGYAGLI